MQNEVLSVRRVTTIPILAMSLSFALLLFSYAVWNALNEHEMIKHDIASSLSDNQQVFASEAYLNQREAIELRLKTVVETIQNKFPKSSICIGLKRTYEQTYEIATCLPANNAFQATEKMMPLKFGGIQVATLSYSYYMPFSLLQEGIPLVYAILLVALLIGFITHWLVEKSIQQKIIQPFVQRLKKQSEVDAAEKIAKQVAHDIRSPLTALNTLMKVMTDISEDRRNLFQQSIKRINGIADDLLASHKQKKIIDYVKLKPLINHLVEEKRAEINSQSIVLESMLLDDVSIRVNEVELARIISNMINNSIESINHTGLVKICLTENVQFACITIEDNGSGMPKNILEKLGKENVSYSKEKSTSGSGLGLSHAYQFIQSFGGRIDASSNPGSGTTFKIFLPK